MNANTICRRVIKGTKRFFTNHGADVFSVLAGIGVVATGVTAFNAGRREANEQGSEEVSKGQNLRLPIIFGSGTIACIAGARYCGKLREESLLAAGSVLALYARGQNQSNEVRRSGPSDIEDTGTGDIIFTETFTGRRFKCSWEVYTKAKEQLQARFSICGFVSLNDFYELLCIDEVAGGEVLGWTSDQMVLDPDYIHGSWISQDDDWISYDDALTQLAIQEFEVAENEYEIHYTILPIGSLAGIGPCNY